MQLMLFSHVSNVRYGMSLLFLITCLYLVETLQQRERTDGREARIGLRKGERERMEKETNGS